MKTFILLFVTVAVFLFIFPLAEKVFAATLQFDPSSKSLKVGETAEIKINIQAGSDQVTSADAYITYDQNLLEAQDVTMGTFFPTTSKDFSKLGKIYMAGMIDDPATSKTGTGTLGSVFFRVKANGTSTAVFTCEQGATTDSNITKNDLNATDVIQCSGNGKATITVGDIILTPTPTTGVAVSTATSTPTLKPTPPKQLEQTGTLDNIVKYSVPGAVLLFLGGVVRFLL